MTNPQPAILGVGYAVPPNLRANDDPIFDWLKSHISPGSNPFQGYKTRVVLGPGEDLMTLMVPAALNALQAANLKPLDIDMLLGCASVSPHITPNELSRLHQMLHLAPSTYVVALNNEYSNFNAGLLFADALIRAGRAKHILIVAAGDWTRHVDYHTVQSISAADGAGAAIVGVSCEPAQWYLVDSNTVTKTAFFGSMYMQGRKYQQRPPRDGNEWLMTEPFFHIIEEGTQALFEFGGRIAPTVVTGLLARHHLSASTITLIPQQSSSVLFDMWFRLFQPKQVIETLENFANLTVATIPVNLAWSVTHRPITENNLVLFALGPDMHANALLLQRTA
jgi:3-oxoacyl-[acyl-carrier-protein] synthase-3